MNTQVLATSPTGGPDAEDLQRIGYRQELHRRLGAFSSAAGFSFVSILTTVFQLFAELASSWPLAGCIYQWSRRLAGYIVSVAAIGIALQAVLPAVWSGFQIVGDAPSITSASGAANGILLGSILIAIATVISAVGVRVMALIMGIGMMLEIVGVVLLVLLVGNAERGPRGGDRDARCVRQQPPMCSPSWPPP